MPAMMRWQQHTNTVNLIAMAMTAKQQATRIVVGSKQQGNARDFLEVGGGFVLIPSYIQNGAPASSRRNTLAPRSANQATSTPSTSL